MDTAKLPHVLRRLVEAEGQGVLKFESYKKVTRLKGGWLPIKETVPERSSYEMGESVLEWLKSSSFYTGITKEQVEAGAREAFFTDDVGGHILGGYTWDTIPEEGRENYRIMVRAVLHAALNVRREA